MKKFLTTFIYSTLAILAVGYLSRTMHWEGSETMLWGGFWLHIASYIGYSFVVRIKDNRMIYPLIILVLIFLLRFFSIEVSYNTSLIGFFVIFLAYVGFHMLTPNYLAYGENKLVKIVNIILLSFFVIAGIFKVMHVQGADMILELSVGGIAFMLMIQGWLKGRAT